MSTEHFVIVLLVAWVVWTEIRAARAERWQREERRDLLARIQARSAGEYQTLLGRDEDEESERAPLVRRQMPREVVAEAEARPGVGPLVAESPGARMTYDRVMEYGDES